MAEEAGWSAGLEVLKFVAIKGLEILASTYLTPLAVQGIAALGTAIEHEVGAKVAEITTAALAESVAAHRAEQQKGSDIDDAKEKIGKVTKRLAASFNDLANESIHWMPDVMPYSHWLKEVYKTEAYLSLEKFRIPPLFPHIDGGAIRAIVAGVLVGALVDLRPALRRPHGPALQVGVPMFGPNAVFEAEDGEIEVGGQELDQAQIRSPHEELRAAIVHQVPIHDLPTVPLVVNVSAQAHDDREVATRLMAAFRMPDAADATDVPAFLQAYYHDGSPMNPLFVTRNPSGSTSGGIGVFNASGGRGHALAEHLALYTWATSDVSLDGLTATIRSLVQGDVERVSRPDEPVSRPDEGIGQPIPAADLAQQTQDLLENEQTKRAGGRALIEHHVDNLVPTSEGSTVLSPQELMRSAR